MAEDVAPVIVHGSAAPSTSIHACSNVGKFFDRRVKVIGLLASHPQSRYGWE